MKDPTPIPASSVAASSRGIAARPVHDEADRVRAQVRLVKAAAVTGGLRAETCPMCGVNPAGPSRPRRIIYVPPWVYVGLALNIFVLALLYYIGRKQVTLELGLCPDCAAADKRARNIRSVGLAGLAFSPILGALLGEPFGGAGMLIGAGIGTVAGLVGTVAAHLHTRFSMLTCKKIDGDTVTLEGSGHLPTVLGAERPELLADNDVGPPR